MFRKIRSVMATSEATNTAVELAEQEQEDTKQSPENPKNTEKDDNEPVGFDTLSKGLFYIYYKHRIMGPYNHAAISH